MPSHLDRFDEKKEYYAILGAGEDASPAEIDRLYKRLAHKRHPDRGGDEEDMKMLNEAYRVLRDDVSRSEYDSQRRAPASKVTPMAVTSTARDVGASGQLLSALLCLALGVMLLLLVRFNGLWFLWPLSILALGVILFGIMIAHSAMTNVRNSFAAAHPARRFRAAQEIVFWSLVFGGGVGLYLIMTTL
ncbi:MAG: J domain-containing protein [Acidobacteriota bacterium]